MVKVKIDGITVEVEPGTTVLDAAKKAGVKIPWLCAVKDLYEGASCRLCLVKTPQGRLFPACAHRVYSDEEFTTNTPDLKIMRKVNLELILKFHRIECWQCPRKGGCILSDLAKDLGVEGVPVCSECPLPPSECLLNKGVLCLGPITLAGCNAECILSGSPCWGCRGPVTRRDLLERAARRYSEAGFNLSEVIHKAHIFWNSTPGFDVFKKVFDTVSRP